MPSPWIWVDFENTPHVLFLEPFVRALAREGWTVRMTAKPQSQTLELAAARGFEVEVTGGGEFSSLMEKAVGAVSRTAALVRWVRRQGRPRLLISSSRTAGLAARVLGIPGIGVMDYEHSEHRTLALGSRSLWLPDVLRHASLPWLTRRVARFFPGLKENLYLDTWPLDRDASRRSLGLGGDEYLVVARPPAESAHYASNLSGRLWSAVVTTLSRRAEVRIVTVPRNARQRQALRQAFQAERRIQILDHTVMGPELVGGADLVIGGGGTMNREAAVLGVPVWSVFTGPTPQVDASLSAEGRLRWLRSDSEVATVVMEALPGHQLPRGPFPGGLAAILADVRSLLLPLLKESVR
jgi:uncharacterized protein